MYYEIVCLYAERYSLSVGPSFLDFFKLLFVRVLKKKDLLGFFKRSFLNG